MTDLGNMLYKNSGDELVAMSFKIDDLEQIPLPCGRRGSKPNKRISLSKNTLYFSNPICVELGLKNHGHCNLKMLPNGKGFLLLLDADGFNFTVGGHNARSGKANGLALNGKGMAEYLRSKFNVKWFNYKDLGGGLVYITPCTEEAES